MHPVATLASLVQPVTAQIGDTKILVLRHGDGVVAFGAECPHAGAPLGEGAFCDGRIICPWHKANFRVSDGGLLEPPALQGLTRYPVTIEGGLVLVSPEPLPPEPLSPEPLSPVPLSPGPSPLETTSGAVPQAPPVAPDTRTMLILGAGAAGTAAACALREFGFSGRVILLGMEPGAPYDRTALSKFVLQGAMPPDQAPPLREPGFFKEQRIEHLHDEAVGLDRSSRQVSLRSGGTLGFDRVLIATGGAPRRLEVPGSDLRGVHVLRSREDAASILAALPDKTMPVVIVGGSFIGLEAASALREQGLAVTVISPQEIPFEAQFGTAIGTMFRRLHEKHGVRWICGRKVERIEGQHAASGVILDDGRSVPAGLILAGLGITPATGFAGSLERTEDGGILVDSSMRAADGVFAAGDAARFPFGGGAGLRVEHWRVAQQLARIAAAGMLDQPTQAVQTPFFWTYHYGKRYEYLGHPKDFDRVDIDGDLDGGEFLARLNLGDRLVGVVACEREAETASLIATHRFSAV